jgi:two-component system sensor histidine kinase QseC
MTLQRRLLLLLLMTAPAVWLATLVLTVLLSSREVRELFDTRQVRLAQQVLAMLPDEPRALMRAEGARAAPPGTATGDADLEEMAISVAGADGRLIFVDHEGERLPRDAPPGFHDLMIDGVGWRLFTLTSADGRWRVTVGQLAEEYEEVLRDLILAQGLPLLVALPFLLAALAWAVRRALAPLDSLRRDLTTRAPTDLRPLDVRHAPGEIQPLLESMNSLLRRVDELILHERRLIADAAHELRTPLAALAAQWEAAEAASEASVRQLASARVGQGIRRLSRLVGQLLALATTESIMADRVAAGQMVNWTRIVEDAMSDCLPLIESSGVEVEVLWQSAPEATLPIHGSEPLLTTLLRNLLDNALRYSSRGAQVRLRMNLDQLSVEDDGPGIPPEAMNRIGDRFFRPSGQLHEGSGLGLSIARRIAELHRLSLAIESPPAGSSHGVCVTLRHAD